MDTQQIEIIGRNFLISAFTADGLEVAEPIRDKGIDLIVFDDVKSFRAYPVQLKASLTQGFSVNSKYVKFTNLLMAYTWFSADVNKTELYVMPYEVATDIAESFGWTKTKSWTVGGTYSTQRPSKLMLQRLRPFKYEPGGLRELFDTFTAQEVVLHGREPQT